MAKASLKLYVNRAQEYLGYSIKKTTTDTTIMIFNNIDNRDPDQEFLCEIALEGPNKREYKVLRCEPNVEDIKDLEKKLNESNDLSGFVVSLRKRFKTISLTN